MEVAGWWEGGLRCGGGQAQEGRVGTRCPARPRPAFPLCGSPVSSASWDVASKYHTQFLMMSV